jgi:steroid delta-isomerase-like uncharacterized protein
MAHNYRKLAEHVYDIFTRGAVDELPGVFATDFIEHQEVPGADGTPLGAVTQWVQMSTTGLSNLNYRIDSVVGSGNQVVCRVQLQGTHTGEFMGVPATGNKVDVMIMDWVRLTDDGKIAEHWGCGEDMRLMEQLGLTAGASTIDLTQKATAKA